MKIAILSCNTGGGHNAAAAALAEELSARGHESRTYNTLDFLPKGAADLISRGHDFAYRYAPKLYGAGYRMEEKRPSPLLYENSIRGIGPLYEALVDLGADAAICVHVFPAMMMTGLRCGYGLRMPTWFVAALTYVAYNLLGAIGIMAPLGKYLRGRKAAIFGIALGGLLLAVVAGSVLTSLSGYLDATAAQMPMVALASRLNPALGIVYGMLLLFGMFSNALASLVAFMEYMNSNIRVLNTHRKSTMAVLMVLVWAASLAGFGNLVGTVFPVFGYIGIGIIVCICIHYAQCLRRKKL